MLSHASRVATSHPSPFFTILQSAAGRAWNRTRPQRVLRYSTVQTKNVGNPGESSKAPAIKIGRGSRYSQSLSAQTSEEHTVQQCFPQTSVNAFDLLEDGDANQSSHYAYTSRSPLHRLQDDSRIRDHPPHEEVPPAWHPHLSRDTPSSSSSATTTTQDDDPPGSSDASIPKLLQVQPIDGQGLLPRTPQDLYEGLLRLLQSDPPPPLPSLIRYHATYRSLQSTQSYNLLISLSIFHASFGTARKLLNRMEFQNIEPDLETRKLRVRLLVRTGNWSRAWRLETSTMHNTEFPLPFPVWAEFFGTTKRGTLRRLRTLALPSGETVSNLVPVSPAETENPHTNVHLRRFRILMEHLPNDQLYRVDDVPARFIRTIVDAALSLDQPEYARKLTEHYFRNLPRELDDAWLDVCLEIIHLHMVRVKKRGLPNYYTSMRILYNYLALHPQFRPTSKTLFLLLRPLRATKNGGSFGQRVVNSFKARWGPDVIDDSVTRRVASFAVKEGRLDIAQAALAEEPLPGHTGRTSLADSDARTSSEVGASRTIQGRWHRSIYSRRNVERWRWRLLRRQVWRLARKKLSVKQSM
ncbi:unnamed protein product [Somion occarium]|uniref:Uncharacterized protein n=1 Tax=Somion occarium TaxID=3059160 RepID=A0ABP1CKM2_9APHY